MSDRALAPGVTAPRHHASRAARWQRHPTPLPLPDLQHALAEDRFRPRYQPIVRLSDGALCGVEVLARLNHPSRGTVLPDWFMPQLENAGLWRPLLEAIAGQGFAELANPSLAALDLGIAINLPLDALLDESVLVALQKERREVGLEGARLTIELTENCHPVEDHAALARALTRWRAGGFVVSLDDITPGVPRWRELLALPFDAVKLDRSVTIGSAHNAGMRRFLQQVVAQARLHGITVVAEGLESPRDWGRMRRFGVHHAQGFVIARPMPAHALQHWLRGWLAQGAAPTRR